MRQLGGEFGKLQQDEGGTGLAGPLHGDRAVPQCHCLSLIPGEVSQRMGTNLPEPKLNNSPNWTSFPPKAQQAARVGWGRMETSSTPWPVAARCSSVLTRC